ncbi:MAG: TldD/PmbA family protein [Thaumarchaeota archaeon]|nr:TldD/PmbA family protein [Nitrososphaerota archaeon]
MDFQGLNELALKQATRLGAEDAIALTASGKQRMIRFANNSVTVVNHVEEAEMMVYVAKSKRRAIAATSNLDPANVRRFVSNLFSSLKGLAQSEYVPLPDKARKFSPNKAGFDRKLDQAGSELPELAKAAISASLKAGGKRSAGVIEASTSESTILTSSGTVGADAGTSIKLNIRSFAENDASGHGLSCSSTLADFDPESAGERAGADAKRMVKASEPEPGRYQVILSPEVASNLIESVSDAASAFSVDAGTSYLADKLGKKVAAASVSLTDHGWVKGGLGGRGFDDEGTPTQTTEIIRKGVLKSYLHNLTTAKKWRAPSTGSAGLVTPHPWNLEVGSGDATYDEMVKETKKGIILTSNWYTRFKNYRTGEFSTVPRDGAYLVEGGRVTKPLKGMRAGDDLQRMFSSVEMLSKQRDWVEWWEVSTPTLCPWILADGVKITRAYE